MAGVAAVASMLLVAPAALAKHHQFRIGVAETFVRPASDIPPMDRAKVETLRVVFNWSRIERVRGARGRCDAVYDWRYTDRIVGETGRRGIRLLPVIIGSPDYVPGAETNAPSTRSRSIGDYKCFVQALVGRYGRGGDYVATDPAARFIGDWQVWNEPSIRAYAPNRKVNAREYGRLVKVSHRAIVSADRKANVVLAGVPERFRRGMNGRPFLKQMHKVKRIKRSYDVVAFHPYARDHRGVIGGVQRIRRLLRSLGMPRRPVWITEVGWATDGPKGHFAVRTERGQAKQLAKTLRSLRRKHKRLKVGTVTWYSWRDTAEPGDANAYWHEYTGLYRSGGEPKPACSRLARLTGGRRCLPVAGVASASAAQASSTSVEPAGASRGIEPSAPPR